MTDAVVFEKISIPAYLACRINVVKRRLYYFDSTWGFSAISKIVPEAILGVAKIDFHASEISDGREESLIFRIVHYDIGAAWSEIMDKLLGHNNVISAITSYTGASSKDKISRYCISNASIPLMRHLVYINALRWYFLCRGKNTTGGIRFVINSAPYIGILQAYASKKGNIVLRNRIDLAGGAKRLAKALFYLFIKPMSLFAAFIIYACQCRKVDNIRGTKPCISMFYANYRDMTFNLNEKNDFFWLQNSWIDDSRLIVYFNKARVRFDADAAEEFERRGMRYIRLSDRIMLSRRDKDWIPSLEYFGHIFTMNLAVCRTIISDILSGSGGTLYFMKDYFEFTHNYAYWRDFFKSLHIKIDINQHDSMPQSIAMRLALENAGGISVSYQRSDCSVPAFQVGSTADVYFAFGKGYIKPFKESRFMVNTLLISGYLTDYVFTRLRESALELRQKLSSNGAKYIISFFDENSSDDKFFIRKNAVLAEMYRRILEKVMKDDSLGLIIKSKRPSTLRQRLGDVNGLLNGLCDTGRCLVLDKGCHVSSLYPSQAAQASDISIGLLSGGTTVLESVLSGTPALYLDVEKLYAYEQYRAGKGVFVFDSIDNLLEKIEELRENRGMARQLNGLLDLINEKDPFRDGRANERMGIYLRWLLDSFDENLSRERALERAARLYGDRWGKDKVCHF